MSTVNEHSFWSLRLPKTKAAKVMGWSSDDRVTEMYSLLVWQYLYNPILINHFVLLKLIDTLSYAAFEVTNEGKFSMRTKIENLIERCVDCFKIFDDEKWIISKMNLKWNEIIILKKVINLLNMGNSKSRFAAVRTYRLIGIVCIKLCRKCEVW